MSLYEPSPSYYRDTVPYTSSDIGEPVPGWGTTVRIAGPARVGMGAATVQKYQLSPIHTLAKLKPGVIKSVASQLTTMPRTAASDTAAGGGGTAEEEKKKEEEADKPIPWWVFPTAAAVLLGGVGWYGTKKGWF